MDLMLRIGTNNAPVILSRNVVEAKNLLLTQVEKMLRQPIGCWAQEIHCARLSMTKTRDMRNISYRRKMKGRSNAR